MPPFIAISLSINAGLYTGPQDNITNRNHLENGGGLKAIINSKFLTEATLFTDSVKCCKAVCAQVVCLQTTEMFARTYSS